MLERSAPILRVACLVLGGLVLIQLSWLAVRKDPLSGLRIPRAGLSSAALNAKSTATATNSPPSKTTSPEKDRGRPPAPAMGPGQSPFLAGLDPEIKGRIERITESEILGPVMRPPPMALLGVAGEHAFIRAPDGQTGLLKEGETLGTLKLLQIGNNRVLVEVSGEKKELMIFSGFGSETLLPTGKDKPQ